LGVTAVLLTSLANAGEAPEDCKVASLTNIVPASAGFSVSPADSNIIAFARPAGRAHQVYIYDRRAKTERCLTCESILGAPAANRHKGSPSFLPDGKRLVMQVEMASHPFEGIVGAPGAGWYNDIWMTTLEGDRWWNLTNYPSGKADTFGALIPEPSPDGSKLIWAELFDDDPRAQAAYRRGNMSPGGAPWGIWRVRLADIKTDASGAPTLNSLKAITLPAATWYETQGWSRDGNFIMFASDANQKMPQAMDLWVHNLKSGQSANLTKNPDGWEEFGEISPDGKLIAFMSSSCCDYKPDQDRKKLRADLYLTTPDRKWTERLTFYNERGHPHAKDGPGGSTVTKLRWSGDGTKLYFERPFYGTFGFIRGSWLTELTFAGSCGALR
jgi:Tol biopolymer transport system component